MSQEKLTPMEMVLALNKMQRPLQTGFECDFHDSVMKKLQAGGVLTTKQDAKLREIYEKYFTNGSEDTDPEDEVDL
jgi:hypothetical protein